MVARAPALARGFSRSRTGGGIGPLAEGAPGDLAQAQGSRPPDSKWL